MLPASESPWSTFPWFVGLLGRCSTHKQVLGRAEAQVGKPGIRIPHILQQREYQDAARERVLCLREKMKAKPERGNSILVKVFLSIFESLPACQAGHYGSSCLGSAAHRESYSSDIRRLAGKRGTGAFCGCSLRESLNARYALLECCALVCCAVVCCALVWFAVVWFARVWFACWHARVIKESNTPNCMQPIGGQAHCRIQTSDIANTRSP